MIGYALTLTEVAKILKISTKLTSRLIHEGKLPAVKVGREYRIARDSLQKYLLGKPVQNIEYVLNVTSNPQVWTSGEVCGILSPAKESEAKT